jgi:Flp pilus assembly protein TadG
VTRNSSPSPREFLQRLVGDKRGATVVFVALASTVLIGFVGLGVEAGMWYAVKRQDQSAAEAAAI